MKKYLFFLILPLFCACSSNTNGQDSDSEKTICTKWSEYYNCQSDCIISSENGQKTFTVSLFNGKKIDLIEPDVISSRVALTTYQYFRDSTKTKFDIYQTKVINSISLDTSILNFTIEELCVLEAKTKICEDFLFLLAEKKINQLPACFAPVVFEKTSEVVIMETFEQINQNYGTLLSSNILGYSKPKQKIINDKPLQLFQLTVVMIMENQNVNLTFILNMDPRDNGIYGFK